MVDFMIEICKDKQLDTIYRVMLLDNYLAIKLFKKMGFAIEYLEENALKATLKLKEELDYTRNTKRMEMEGD